MGLVARPPKAAGTSQYQTEFAAGAIGIQDTEVDADFETLYRLVNGNLDTSNLSRTAAISYDQLSLTGRIVNADISPSANLDGHKIAANTIPWSAVIAPSGTIPGASLAPNSVGLPQLVLGAATNFIYAVGLSPVNPTNPGTEYFTNQVSWTARGGWWFCLASIFGIVGSDGAAPAPSLTVTLKSGGTAGNPDGTMIGQNSVANFLTSTGEVFFPYGIITTQIGHATAGAAMLLKTTAMLGGRLVGTCQVQDGWMLVAEFA